MGLLNAQVKAGHAMAGIAVDDRDEVKEAYNCKEED